MIQHEISSQVNEYNKQIQTEQSELERIMGSLESMRTPANIIDTYNDLKEKSELLQKQSKKTGRKRH